MDGESAPSWTVLPRPRSALSVDDHGPLPGERGVGGSKPFAPGEVKAVSRSGCLSWSVRRRMSQAFITLPARGRSLGASSTVERPVSLVLHEGGLAREQGPNLRPGSVEGPGAARQGRPRAGSGCGSCRASRAIGAVVGEGAVSWTWCQGSGAAPTRGGHDPLGRIMAGGLGVWP